MPSCSSAGDDASVPPSPTQNAAASVRPDPHFAFGWIHVPVTSLKVATPPAGAAAMYPDQFELTSGVAAKAPPATTSDAARAVATAIEAFSTARTYSAWRRTR